MNAAGMGVTKRRHREVKTTILNWTQKHSYGHLILHRLNIEMYRDPKKNECSW